MEKYFIIKDEGIINEWKEYLRLCDVERELFRLMKEEFGFETSKFFLGEPVLSWSLKGKNLIGKSSQTLYEVDGVLYARFELNGDYQIDDGQVEEIKASEFYKIAEDYNEKIKTGE